MSILFYFAQQHGKSILLQCFLTLCLLISTVCFSAQVEDEPIKMQSQNRVCVAEIRTVQIAKEIRLSAIGLPIQAKWSEVKSLPDQWQERWPDYQGNVWYRIKWNYQCPKEQQNSLSLMIASISMAGQIFVNENLLWQSKSLTNPLSMHWNMPRQWIILPAGLKQGENEI